MFQSPLEYLMHSPACDHQQSGVDAGKRAVHSHLRIRGSSSGGRPRRRARRTRPRRRAPGSSTRPRGPRGWRARSRSTPTSGSRSRSARTSSARASACWRTRPRRTRARAAGPAQAPAPWSRSSWPSRRNRCRPARVRPRRSGRIVIVVGRAAGSQAVWCKPACAVSVRTCLVRICSVSGRPAQTCCDVAPLGILRRLAAGFPSFTEGERACPASPPYMGGDI